MVDLVTSAIIVGLRAVRDDTEHGRYGAAAIELRHIWRAMSDTTKVDGVSQPAIHPYYDQWLQASTALALKIDAGTVIEEHRDDRGD
jgi:hypothetical protein